MAETRRGEGKREENKKQVERERNKKGNKGGFRLPSEESGEGDNGVPRERSAF